MVRYGAKALPEGGWNTIPRCYMDGGLIVGDAGGFLNSMRLKGIHLAMRTRDAGGRDRVRGGPRGRHVRGGAEGATRTASTRARSSAELYPGAQRAPGVRLRALRRAGVRRAVGR